MIIENNGLQEYIVIGVYVKEPSPVDTRREPLLHAERARMRGSQSVRTHAVPAHPPIYAALAPYIAAEGPCARLVPNSMTPLPSAARTILLALVAMRL